MAYKQRWLEYFDILDADGNGHIDSKDVEIHKKRLSEGTGDKEAAIAACVTCFSGFFRDFDANQDGKITKEEWLAGVEKHFIGKPADKFPAWWQANITHAFNTCDLNKNGSLSKEELLELVKTMNPKIASREEEFRKAYAFAEKLSDSGKVDAPTYVKLVTMWATSPDPFPESYFLIPPFVKP